MNSENNPTKNKATDDDVLQLHDEFFSTSKPLEFEEIDHGPTELMPQELSIHENCLVINFDAFDKYYEKLLQMVSRVNINDYSKNKQNTSEENTNKNNENNQTVLSHSYTVFLTPAFKAADILLCFNGENDKAWNFKKHFLGKIDPTTSKPYLDIDRELKLNHAVCLKCKKSSSYYEYRLRLIEKKINDEFESIIGGGQNGGDDPSSLLKEEEVLTFSSKNKIFEILEEENKLISRVLERYFRNYFCWNYRIKLIKLIQAKVTKLLQSIQSSQPLSSSKKNENSLIVHLSLLLYEIKLSEINYLHKFLSRYSNDYSGYSYLINFIKRNFEKSSFQEIQPEGEREISPISSISSASLSETQWKTFVEKEIEWIEEMEEYCSLAYKSEKDYQHMTMYASFFKNWAGLGEPSK